MIVISRLLRIPLLMTSIAVLSACDSGSGDELDKPSGLELEPGDYAGERAAATDLEALEFLTETEGLVRDTEDFMLVLMDRLDEAWEGEAGDNPEECYQGNDNLTVTYDSGNGGDFARYKMDDCVVPGYGESARLDGTMGFETQTGDEGVVTTVTYNIEGSRGGRTLDLFGTRTTRVTTSGDSNTQTRITADQMEYELASRYIALWNYESNTLTQGDGLSRSVEGIVVDSEVDGFVQVSTPVTVAWDDEAGGCPDRGHVKYQGVGTLEVRYGENSGNGQGQEWLANGSDLEYRDTCEAVLGVTD
jgi:hypothetical protein